MFTDRMVLLISHRFSTVRLAITCYVLEGGKIIEGGTHDDLMHRAASMPNSLKSRQSPIDKKGIAECTILQSAI